MHRASHDSEKPAHGQQAITACAFIHHDFDGIEKVLLSKRAATKKFLPGVFELPGGHIDIGEDIIEGLKREVLEEHEMHITVGDPFAVFTYTNEVKGSHSIEVVYFATFIGPIENIRIHPEDHSEYRWFARDEIEAVEEMSDTELNNVRRGFELLYAQPLNFG